MASIRLLTVDDLPEIHDLISYAFLWDAGERNRARLEHLLRHAAAYGAFEDGGLASQIISLPFTVGFHGRRFQANGIGFVATYPEFRGRGHVRELMNRILRVEREQGTCLSFLAPFSYPFYRAFGYEHVFDRFDFDLRVADWPDGARGTGTVRRMSWDRAREDVAAVYAAGEPGRPCGLVREPWWEAYKFQLRRDYQFAVAYDAAGLPRGYLAYQLKDRILDVFELEWTDTGAFQALSRFIRSHQADFSLRWSCLNPADLDRIPLSADPERFVSTRRPYMMARIVDVEAFLRRYPFAGVDDFAFGLRIASDPSAPWNEGLYLVRRVDGASSVDKRDARSACDAPVLDASVQRLAQLLLGYAGPERILISDGAGIEGGEAERRALCELLERIVPAGRPAMEDYF